MQFPWGDSGVRGVRAGTARGVSACAVDERAVHGSYRHQKWPCGYLMPHGDHGIALAAIAVDLSDDHVVARGHVGYSDVELVQPRAGQAGPDYISQGPPEAEALIAADGHNWIIKQIVKNDAGKKK